MQPLDPQNTGPSGQVPLSSAASSDAPPPTPPSSPYGSAHSYNPAQSGPLPPQPPSPYLQPYGVAPVVGADKKLAAGLCGILLGGLDVHKFILGYNTEGIIMAAISIATCGFAAPIISIIGLMEGIIYLTKSDQQFVQEYVVNKKPWF